ncbi:hypothetical protein JCM17844_04700 [Iodidimonas gelatinilytica]|uniref:Bacterial surface antigen (D15) domain-containing protein n=1 Tax=Iodidimonas gelatinilytica TaxID=1236966 RepID=A0A5A7MNV6_9PROT|nr:BamA/TamA family outer membrane protein [Iodidimonas gelatinilytica]GEQ96833.1 hypothetical protein JCM17844_04700 [Iodidimonas gelatinilytica]
MFLPLGEAAREMGVQASLYLDAASLFELSNDFDFEGEAVFGDTAEPRVSVGVGVAWESPFGPFRIDFAKILKSQPFDDTKSFQFNVGTSF